MTTKKHDFYVLDKNRVPLKLIFSITFSQIFPF